MLFARVEDNLSQHADTIRQPGQLFCGDLVVLRVAGLHLGGAKQFECASLELGRMRPDLDQARNERLC